MILAFPEFNIYSTPLLVLVSQGLIFAGLLCLRAYRKASLSDLFLGLLVLITCYHRTTYTIGFMGWYDTFRETKINYWLIPLTLAVGPLIYFYLKAITRSDFRLKAKDWLHFLPLGLFIAYRLFILGYDATQAGFELQQNGELMRNWNNGSVGAIFGFVETLQQALYLAFSIQLYFGYRRQLKNYFSNTYDLELTWMLNFLLIYTFLFLYGNLQFVIDLTVDSLSWIQKWWKDFFSALAVIYIGIKGYFTPTDRLSGLGFDPDQGFKTSEKVQANTTPRRPVATPENLEEDLRLVQEYLSAERAYLNPELNLKDLARALGMSRASLSETINHGLGKNFNDFVNTYRLSHFKALIRQGRHKEHSLLGIAYDSGFNSKATFNRVFRKLEGTSPSEFLKARP